MKNITNKPVSTFHQCFIQTGLESLDDTINALVKELYPLALDVAKSVEKTKASVRKKWGFDYSLWDKGKDHIEDFYIINYYWNKYAPIDDATCQAFLDNIESVVEAGIKKLGWKKVSEKKGKMFSKYEVEYYTKTFSGTVVEIYLYTGDNDGNSISPEIK